MVSGLKGSGIRRLVSWKGQVVAMLMQEQSPVNRFARENAGRLKGNTSYEAVF